MHKIKSVVGEMPAWVLYPSLLYSYLAFDNLRQIVLPVYQFVAKYSDVYRAKCGFVFHLCDSPEMEYIRYNQDIAVQDFLGSVGVVATVLFIWAFMQECQRKSVGRGRSETHLLGFKR